MTDALPRLYTLKEVSEQTGFSLRMLADDCRAGRIEHVHRGRDRLMTATQVEALIVKHTTGQPAVDTDRIAAQKRLERMMRPRLRRAS